MSNLLPWMFQSQLSLPCCGHLLPKGRLHSVGFLMLTIFLCRSWELWVLIHVCMRLSMNCVSMHM